MAEKLQEEVRELLRAYLYMEIIIVQGMACLGKSTLCKQLEEDLPNCKHFSLDEYKENMWDKFGFDSVEQREYQSKLARELFYKDINEAVKKALYDYILIDYTFSEKYWDELLNNLTNWDGRAKTIYLKPANLQEHRKIWEIRSRDFSVRHAGHGATHYHDGAGVDFQMQDIHSTTDGSLGENPLIANIVNKFRNAYGKPVVVVIQSQLGDPIFFASLSIVNR